MSIYKCKNSSLSRSAGDGYISNSVYICSLLLLHVKHQVNYKIFFRPGKKIQADRRVYMCTAVKGGLKLQRTH